MIEMLRQRDTTGVEGEVEDEYESVKERLADAERLVGVL